MKKEIERRFLLKDLPIGSVTEIQDIIQYYYTHNSVEQRIRKIESNLYGTQYLHTIKTYVDGVTFEVENYYSYMEYINVISNLLDINSKMIAKTRYIYLTGQDADFEGEIKNIKWEIDKFNFSLIVAEIEIPDLNFEVNIPQFIQDKIICEVTGIRELANRNLAQPIIR